MSTAFIPNQSSEHNNLSAGTVASPSRYLCFGAFLLDMQRQELFKDGARVKLQGKVCEALLALLERPGDVVTREALRMRLWPLDEQVNYDANVNTTVNKLRQVLGDSPEQPAYVETIPRKGYSFVAKVECTDNLPIHVGRSAAESTLRGTIGDATDSNHSFFWGVTAATWFRAGVVALVIASILFGAAITLFAHRGV
jgi:DNA-binding winged helix-turn-helix (wHTH) protein